MFSKNKTKKGHCSENLILSASFEAISIIKKMPEILYTKNQNADAENSLIKNCCFALSERCVRKCQKYFTFFAFFALKKNTAYNTLQQKVLISYKAIVVATAKMTLPITLFNQLWFSIRLYQT